MNIYWFKFFILYINQSINLLINPYFMVKIILVQQTAKFWDGTDSLSSEQANQCSENSWQKLIQLQILQKVQTAVR